MKKYYVENRGLEPLFEDLFFNSFKDKGERYDLMRTDILENEDGYILKAEVPGIKKENIKISLEKGYIYISVSKVNESETKENELVHKERYFGEINRSYYIGEDIKFEDISAKLEEGILTLDIKKPKKEEIQEKKFIDIF